MEPRGSLLDGQTSCLSATACSASSLESHTRAAGESRPPAADPEPRHLARFPGITELVTAREIPSERPLAWLHNARVRYVLLVGALAGAYYAAAQIGYTLKFTGAVAAIVWLPVGVGIAFLYLRGLNLWPGVVLGDLLANQYDTLPVGSAIVQTIGNTLEVLVAAYLIRRLVRSGRPLESVAGVCGLLVAIFAGLAFVLYGLIPHMVPLLQDRGVPVSQASLLA